MSDSERIKEAAARIEQLEAQLASAQAELERWRRMANDITPMLRAMVGEDVYSQIMASEAPPNRKD